MHLLWTSFSSEGINSGNEDDKNDEYKITIEKKLLKMTTFIILCRQIW